MLWKIFFVLAPVLIADSVIAQDESKLPITQGRARIDLNHSNPGARSLGLGGAFAALADDASAAYSNPAGISLLPRSEVSVEAKFWNFEVPYRQKGQTEGEDPFAISTENRNGISFASLVIPTEIVHIGVFYHKLAKFGAEVEFATGNSPDAGVPITVISSAELDIDGIGVSLSKKITSSVYFGLSGIKYSSEFTSTEERYTIASLFLPRDDRSRPLTQRETSDDSDFVINAGLLYRPNYNWQFGAYYRLGSEFKLQRTNEGVIRGSRETFALPDGVLTVPDIYGIGAVYRHNQNVQFVMEISRIDFRDNREALLDADADTGIFVRHDGYEARLGVEYTDWKRNIMPNYRLGVWYEPNLDFEFQSLEQNVSTDYIKSQFPGGKSQFHFALGFGFLALQNVLVDFGIDFADDRTEIALSTVVRF